jgi:hypothetical protein
MDTFSVGRLGEAFGNVPYAPRAFAKVSGFLRIETRVHVRPHDESKDERTRLRSPKLQALARETCSHALSGPVELTCVARNTLPSVASISRP